MGDHGLAKQMATTMDEELQDAIVGLYAAFGDVPLRTPAAGCPCCVEPRDQALLEGTPLRELGGRLLDSYASHAIHLWGDEDHYRHFLPRLLEVLASDPAAITPEFTVIGLERSGWRAWPSPQPEAIERFFHAWWRSLLARYPADPDADTRLCTMAKADVAIAPRLAEWRSNRSEPAVRHLAHLIRTWIGTGAMAPQADAFWKKEEPQYREFADWLFSQDTRITLAAAPSGSAVNREIQEALARLDWATSEPRFDRYG